MPDLSVRTFRFLLDLADAEPSVAMDDIVTGELGGDAETAVNLGLLVPGPNLDGVAVDAGDATLRPVIVFDCEAETLTCFHPEAGFLTLPASRLRTWRLDLTKLANWVVHQLGLPASARAVPLVDGLLWDLGTPRLGSMKLPVLFARRLDDEQARPRIRRELDLRLRQKPALLLTSARQVAADLSLPTILSVLPLVDILDRTQEIARFDIARLAALAGVRSPVQQRPELPVECRDEGHWIRIGTATYAFRGKQAAIVYQLYIAWTEARPWMRVQDVLEEAGSKCDKLSEAFSGNSDWKRVIEVKDGNCRLRADEAF